MTRPTLCWYTVYDAVTGSIVATVQAFDAPAALYALTLLRRRESASTNDLRARAATRDEVPVRRVAMGAIR